MQSLCKVWGLSDPQDLKRKPYSRDALKVTLGVILS